MWPFRLTNCPPLPWTLKHSPLLSSCFQPEGLFGVFGVGSTSFMLQIVVHPGEGILISDIPIADNSRMLIGSGGFFRPLKGPRRLVPAPLLSVPRLICDTIAQASQEYCFIVRMKDACVLSLVAVVGICPDNKPAKEL